MVAADSGTGGRFDGILGILAALEVLRVVKESGYKTFAPLAAVCWTNECVAMIDLYKFRIADF